LALSKNHSLLFCWNC